MAYVLIARGVPVTEYLSVSPVRTTSLNPEATYMKATLITTPTDAQAPSIFLAGLPGEKPNSLAYTGAIFICLP